MFEMTREDWYIFYNTFHSVFPYVYIYSISEGYFGELVMLGSQTELEIKDEQSNYRPPKPNRLRKIRA